MNFCKAIETGARSDRLLAVQADVWDTDPLKLGVPGGYVDLTTGELCEGNPKLYLSRQTSVAPAVPGTQHPRWSQFLTDATGGDLEYQQFLQRTCGYSLTGLVSQEVIFFLYGEGGTGKGTFLHVLTRILFEYAVQVSAEFFSDSYRQNRDYQLAAMAGARLVTASETESGSQMAEALVKELTGNEGKIPARHPFGRVFNFEPQFKPIIAGNHAPKLKGRSSAIARRLKIAPFIHKPANVDRELKAKLMEEYPAILRWMIEGCLELQKSGLGSAKKVDEQIESYLEGQDTFGRWLEERTIRQAGQLQTKPGALYSDYRSWAGENFEDALSNSEFKEAVERLPGVQRKRIKGSDIVRGIALKAPAEAKNWPGEGDESDEMEAGGYSADDPPF